MYQKYLDSSKRFNGILEFSFKSHDPVESAFLPPVQVIAAMWEVWPCCVLPGHGRLIRHGDELTHDTMASVIITPEWPGVAQCDNVVSSPHMMYGDKPQVRTSPGQPSAVPMFFLWIPDPDWVPMTRLNSSGAQDMLKSRSWRSAVLSS